MFKHCWRWRQQQRRHTDARVRVYYKLTLWAWRLRWAKNYHHKTELWHGKTYIIKSIHWRLGSACSLISTLWVAKDPNFLQRLIRLCWSLSLPSGLMNVLGFAVLWLICYPWAISWDYGTSRPPWTHSSNVHAQPSSGARCLIYGRTFVYFHPSCVRTAKNLERLRGCAGSPEPSLVAYVISTILMSWLKSYPPRSGFNQIDMLPFRNGKKVLENVHKLQWSVYFNTNKG